MAKRKRDGSGSGRVKEKEKKRGTMKTARRRKRVERCLCKRSPRPPMEKKEFWAKLELMK